MPRSSATRSRPTLEDFEPRVLHSADHPLGLAAAALQDAAGTARQCTVAAPAIASDAQSSATELVFIDSRVGQADTLLADIAAQAAAGRPIAAVMLDGDADGIDQITAALDAHAGKVSAIHLITHGTEGAIVLGNTVLDGDRLLERAPDIAAWSSHIAPGGDLLLYGCDTGAGIDGHALIEGLAQLTGADVAASTDLTGSALHGGNWTLEAQTGAIQAESAIDAAGQAAWQQELATYVVTNTNNSGAGSLRNAITSANGNSGSDTISFNIAGSGVQTIHLTSLLPQITDTVVIDGYTQAGTSVNTAASGSNAVLKIVIDGSAVGTSGEGLDLVAGSDNSVVRGLVINGFTNYSAIKSLGSSNLTIQGNFLGTDASGTTVVANSSGVHLDTSGSNTLIGGTSLSQRNLIAGNTYANIFINGGVTGTKIYGNVIGMASASTSFGVSAQNNPTGVQLGGTAAGQGNVIVGGNISVHAASSSTTMAVLGNSISGNANVPIDLNNDGVTANDTGDGDSGPNGLQNTPVLTTANTGNGNVDVAGTLNSNASSYYRLEFFASSSGASSGHGAGERYLGYVNVLTNASGNANFNTWFAQSVAGGEIVTATATKTNSTFSSYSVTSEFAANRTVQSYDITSNGGGSTAAINVAENTTAVTTVTAAASGATYAIQGGADAAKFTINASTGALAFITAPNFEAPTDSDGDNVYAVTVKATDGVIYGSQAISVTVTDVNEAPVLTPVAPALPTITEDQTTNAGQSVASFLGSSVGDVDNGAVQGIAITATTSGTGAWQYSLDGGSTWNALGTVSNGSALLLRSSDLVRFVPNGQNGTTGSLTYRAWDQSSGSAGSKVDASTNGGTTAFSTATDTASITVT